MNSFIPLCIPEIRGNEWAYIKECLDTGWVSSVGSFVDRFEREMAARIGTHYAVATINGTTALHVALLIGGVRPNDEVLVSSLTFIAPANAIRYVGAWPIFIDAEPTYWQMDPAKVRHFIEKECYYKKPAIYNKKTQRRVSAIMPVHILGHPVDMDPILDVARLYDLLVIEDATESLGAKYKGRSLGTLGDMACLSFNGNKLMTTGGGGMLLTDNGDWARKARHISTQAKSDEIEFIHDEIGYNYRLTNIQAAMGCAQLELLDDYIEKKRRIASSYEKVLSGVPGILAMREAEWAFCVYWMYTILVDEKLYGMSSRTLLNYLEKENIQTRPLWQPLHRSPAHGTAQMIPCEVADRLNRDALSLPCSVGLTGIQQQRVLDLIASYPSVASQKSI
jgi:perosamine synthetase